MAVPVADVTVAGLEKLTIGGEVYPEPGSVIITNKTNVFDGSIIAYPNAVTPPVVVGGSKVTVGENGAMYNPPFVIVTEITLSLKLESTFIIFITLFDSSSKGRPGVVDEYTFELSFAYTRIKLLTNVSSTGVCGLRVIVLGFE